jgi:hypothetical protein
MKIQGARAPKVDHFLVSVGANDDPNRLNFLGTADLFTMKLRGQPVVTYDFELPRPAPTPVTPPPASSSVVVVNATVISQPTFYYFLNQPCGELHYADGDRISRSSEPEVAKTPPEPEAAKTPPYWSGEDLFIPIGFRGNLNFSESFRDMPPNATRDPFSKGGAFSLGGVPFLMDSEKQVWFAGLVDDIAGSLLGKPLNVTPRVATLNLETLKLKHVKKLFTLINTTWGDEKKPSLELRIKFGSGKVHTKQFLSNYDIRDFNARDNAWTKRIGGSTKQVWRYSDALVSVHMDMQTIDIPMEFYDESISAITIVDTGSYARQRASVFGVTAQVGNVKRIIPSK